MKGARDPVRGIYWGGTVYSLARQVDKKRHFISLETVDPVEALGRAEGIRSQGALEAERSSVTLWNATFGIAASAENGTLSTERGKGIRAQELRKMGGEADPGLSGSNSSLRGARPLVLYCGFSRRLAVQ